MRDKNIRVDEKYTSVFPYLRRIQTPAHTSTKKKTKTQSYFERIK